MSDSEKKPPVWREEWRQPEPRKSSRARARKSVPLDLDAPLPSDPVMRKRAINAALGMLNCDHPNARAAAIKCILEVTEPDARKELLRTLNGDDATLEDWLLRELEACRKRRAEKV